MTDATLSNLLTETRHFDPPAAIADSANVTAGAYDVAAKDRVAFWEEQARRLHWHRPWETALEWELPYAKWFVGGRLNVAYNCLDRHVAAGRGDTVAFHWEGEPGDTRTITYADLLRDVCKAANALTELGVQAGDRVAIYMPMVPETAVAMLACARIGAPHSVVFGGFSAEALSGRILDADARVVITADGAWRRGSVSPLKPAVDEAWRRGGTVPLKRTADEAMAAAPKVHSCLVVQRTGNDVPMTEGRDRWYHELDVSDDPATCPCEPMDSEDLLFLMYTSGTTAKPKGILHTTGGYLTQVAWTHHAVFDLKPETDVYWCAADIGWVTGHSYIVYGPLANGATSVMYEGLPDFPDKDRWWATIAKYGVTILYCAPTAIRTFMKWGEEFPGRHDMGSLRLLGSVGEPINPEAWMWYRRVIGGDRCPVVDTWWQTETGAIMISPLPGVTSTKPGAAMRPLPGISAEVVDNAGNAVPPGGGGYLTLTEPWPSMLRGVWGDDERYRETYWSRYEGRYFAGDGAKLDDDGDVWLLGRVDDVMNVSGHRISTTEVEHALVGHPSVAEAAVVGATDAPTGQGIVAFVTVKSSEVDGDALAADLRKHVAHEIGPIAKPRQIIFTPDLPKTRSGKIMRRLLRDVAESRPLGDVTTLADPSVVEAIGERMASAPPEE